MKKFLKIILIILLVLIVAVVAGFLYLYTHGLSGITCNNGEPREGQIKIACVGDSITYGHGIKGWAKNNYPVRLQNLLGESYHVQSFGVSGARYRTIPTSLTGHWSITRTALLMMLISLYL